MDSTELHYLTYDPDAIWDEIISAYIDAGGDVLYPGDEKELLLRGVQSVLVQVFAGVDNALRMQTLRYAVGDYLDLLGEQRDCARIEATAATVAARITFAATGAEGTLPAGTAFTPDGVSFYATQADIALTGAAQAADATLAATLPGSAGNALLSGTPLQIAAPNSAVLSCVTTADAAGGNDREDDGTYRERLRNTGVAGVTTGPASQYESAAMAVSSQIVSARALNIGDGCVGVYLILSSDAGQAALIAAVTEALSASDVRPLTDRVTVAVAEAVPYTLIANCTLPDENADSAALTEAAEAYRDWQDNTVGRAFNPDRLMAMLYQAGATRVVWGEGSAFDGGDVAYTEIDPDQRCSGTITVQVVTSA